jgi:pyruvate dehydrogenase E2 component (dihydrolipoamide acetyltransferase)
MAEFCMPALGADMDAGTVTEWRVAPGDKVARGDIVAVVETDKADLDVEVFEAGVVTQLLVPVGVRVPVGTPLAVIAADGKAPVPSPPQPPLVPAAVTAPVQESVTRQSHVEPSPVLVGPLVRHLAEDLHVDLAAVHGTGNGGRITRADVLAAGAVRPPSRPRVTPRARRIARERGVEVEALAARSDKPVTGADVERAEVHAETSRRPERPRRAPASRRDAIARLMSRSAREIPHYYVATRLPMAPALAWLADHNASVPVRERVLPAALMLRAVAAAAVAVPELNGEWIEEAFRPGDGVHLGVAVAMRDGGLLTPTIRDAHRKSLTEVMADLRDLVNRARAGRLRAQEMGGATMTVTNLGERGVDAVFGVIVPPQVALVGLGAIHDEPWAEDGLLGVRPVVHASLAADHRATDGLTGARFLEAMAYALAVPEDL